MIDNIKDLIIKPENVYLVKDDHMNRTYFNLLDGHTYKPIDLIIEDYLTDWQEWQSPPNISPWSPNIDSPEDLSYDMSPMPVWEIKAHIIGRTLKREIWKECYIKDPVKGIFYIEWDNEDLFYPGDYSIEFVLVNNFTSPESPAPQYTIFKTILLRIRSNLESLQEIPQEALQQGTVYNPTYLDIIDFVRTQLGEGIFDNVEITDKQIESCVQIALDKFSRYKGGSESIYIIDRTIPENKDLTNGFTVPKEVRKNMFELVLVPRLPFLSYFVSYDWDPYFYFIFGNYDPSTRFYLTDYFIYKHTDKATRDILGTHASYMIFDSKIYVFPELPKYVEIGIRYRKLPEIEDIDNDMWIKKYTLARSMILLGIARSTYKIGIPIGNEITPLNGEDLVNYGMQMAEKLEEEIKRKQEPPMFEIF